MRQTPVIRAAELIKISQGMFQWAWLTLVLGLLLALVSADKLRNKESFISPSFSSLLVPDYYGHPHVLTSASLPKWPIFQWSDANRQAIKCSAASFSIGRVVFTLGIKSHVYIYHHFLKYKISNFQQKAVHFPPSSHPTHNSVTHYFNWSSSS